MRFVKRYGLSLGSLLVIFIQSVLFYQHLVGSYVIPHQTLGETLGKAIVWGLIAFFVMGSLRKRWERKKFEFYMSCFATAFVLCAFGAMIEVHRQTYYINNFQQELVRLGRGEVDTSETAHEYSAKKYGELAQILQIIRHSCEVSAKIGSQIEAAGLALGDIASPAQLCNRENILRAKERVANFIDVLNQCERKHYKELARVEEKFHKILPGKDRVTMRVLKAFEEDTRRASELFSGYLQVERECMQGFDDMLSFLFERVGCFLVEEETFFFETDEDIERYSELAEKLMQYGEKEALAVQELAAYHQSVLQKIENENGVR